MSCWISNESRLLFQSCVMWFGKVQSLALETLIYGMYIQCFYRNYFYSTRSLICILFVLLLCCGFRARLHKCLSTTWTGNTVSTLLCRSHNHLFHTWLMKNMRALFCRNRVHYLIVFFKFVQTDCTSIGECQGIVFIRVSAALLYFFNVTHSYIFKFCFYWFERLQGT